MQCRLEIIEGLIAQISNETARIIPCDRLFGHDTTKRIVRIFNLVLRSIERKCFVARRNYVGGVKTDNGVSREFSFLTERLKNKTGFKTLLYLFEQLEKVDILREFDVGGFLSELDLWEFCS